MLPQKIYDETPTNKKEKKEQQTSPYLVTATESTCVLVPKINISPPPSYVLTIECRLVNKI